MFDAFFIIKIFVVGNNSAMKKKDYIEKAKNTILNRVRFHAPVVYDGRVDKRVLFENGVDVDKPIFKFDKALNKHLLKAFELAQQEEEFNLLLSLSSLGKMKESMIKPLKNCTLYSSQASSARFLEMINKLNINYQSASNYNLVFKDKFFKFNGQILNPKFDDFELKQTLVFDDILCEYHEFVLNGNNHYVNLSNNLNVPKKVELELNIPLAKGYYYFKRQDRHILIENLLTKEKLFLNFVCKNAKFSFSNVDGLENSVFCCINIKVTINLQPNKTEFVFFNLGNSKIALKYRRQIETFFDLSKQQCCEIFNVRVKTKEAKFDQFFNLNLPKKIWMNWLNGEVDAEKEEKYLALKRLFIKGKEQLSFVPFEKIGLKELGIFNGEYYKKILIVKGDYKFLRVGETYFHNINGLTKHSLQSKEPISLSFG